MRKRITALLLALVMLTGLMPLSAAAVVTDAEHAAIQSTVTKIIKDHAKKVYQADADDDAFTDFFVHAFFGNRKDMKLNDKSSMTAAMFNTYLLQEALINGITGAIEASQNMQQDHLTIRGDASWHNYGYGYNFSAYRGNSKASIDRMLTVTSSSSIYGKGGYTGPRNANDELMELLAGALWVSVEVKKVQTKADTAVYTLDLHIWDEFDFTSDYSALANKGYNTSKDQRLVNMGLLMSTIGLDEFNWEYKKSFKVEVPHHCSHRSSAYHWDYDYTTQTLTPDGSAGYTPNNVTRKIYEYKSKDANGVETLNKRIYFTADDTIQLRHDKPWVIEKDWSVANTLQLSATASSSSSMPSIYFYSIYYIWVYFNETVKLPDGQTTASGGTTQTNGHYVGVNITGKFKYSPKYHYTCTLENVVADDGSNMIYCSIYNHDLGEMVFGPEPMDDHWVRYPQETNRTLLSENAKTLSGKDLQINYLGNKSAGWSSKGPIDLRIWENGKETPDASDIVSVHRAPTCTEKGCMVNTCRDCGYTYNNKVEAALGHSYGEYVLDNNAGCTENGTQTRTCTRCGEKDSVAIPDTALGHSFGEYVYDNNASCTEDGTQTRKCTRCDVTETITAANTATGHSYESAVTEPTYTEQGYTTYTCTVCGDSYKDNYVDVKKHSYVGVVTEPTCTAQGFTTYTCSECGDSYVDDYTDMIDHTPVIDPAVKPTCSEKGKTEGSHCGVCGYVIKKQALISTNDNHTMEESIIKMPTYDEPGQLAYICTGCGKADYMEIPPLRKPFENPFTDVTESDWFFEPVLWAVQEGVTGGKTETTFAPNEGCTRAQVVTFLWAANGKPEPTRENPFTDVSNDVWYLKPVLWAVENGITTGVTATEFGPEQTCTRAQIATFLWAANGKPAVSASSEFVDVGDTDWYSTPIIWAKENDVTGGIGNGKFGPNDTCTRAQVVTFLNKVYNK